MCVCGVCVSVCVCGGEGSVCVCGGGGGSVCVCVRHHISSMNGSAL